MKKGLHHVLAEPCRAPEGLIEALKRILRPLVRLLLVNNVTFGHLTNILKGIFVDVADKEFPVDGKRQTDSRISLLTGIHRKDVRRLRHADPSEEGPPENVTIGGEIVARWIGDGAYLDEDEQPMPLPRLKSKGVQRSFEHLVESVSRQDLRSRAVLDELVRLRVVSVEDDDLVHLNMQAFIPDSGLTEKIYYFGQNVGDHIAAAACNLSEQKDPFFDRSVYYDELSEGSVEVLKSLSRELGMKALQVLNRKALQLREQDAGKEQLDNRINFGAFFFSTNNSGEDKNA